MAKENVPERKATGWIKSSRSNGSSACVQVRFTGHGTVLVRDGKDLHAAPPIISMPLHGWASLLTNLSTAA